MARIRSNRDELKAEISELKAKDLDKMHALGEMRTLAEARKSRLQAYASELRRLRIGQAGDRGDLEGVELRVRHAEAAAAADEMEEGEVEIGEDEVAKDLQKRLTKAEELLRALSEQLRAYAASSSSSSGGANGASGPDPQALIESETRARSDLVEARQRVEKLEALLGPGGRADVREMAERLEEKGRELKAAEAKVASQEAVSAAAPAVHLSPCTDYCSRHRPRRCCMARSSDYRRHGSLSTSRTRQKYSTSAQWRRSCSD